MPVLYDGYEKLKNRIISNAKKRAQKILKSAKEKKKALLEESKKKALMEVAARKEQYINEVAGEGIHEAKRILSQAENVARVKILEVKRKVVDEIIARVRKEMLELREKDPELYKKLLAAMIKKGAISLNGGDIVVMLSERDKNLGLDLNTIAGEIVTLTGERTRLTLSTHSPKKLVGGVILHTADGVHEVDYSLDTVINNNRRYIEAEIYRIFREKGIQF